MSGRKRQPQKRVGRRAARAFPEFRRLAAAAPAYRSGTSGKPIAVLMQGRFDARLLQVSGGTNRAPAEVAPGAANGPCPSSWLSGSKRGDAASGGDDDSLGVAHRGECKEQNDASGAFGDLDRTRLYACESAKPGGPRQFWVLVDFLLSLKAEAAVPSFGERTHKSQSAFGCGGTWVPLGRLSQLGQSSRNGSPRHRSSRRRSVSSARASNSARERRWASASGRIHTAWRFRSPGSRAATGKPSSQAASPF